MSEPVHVVDICAVGGKIAPELAAVLAAVHGEAFSPSDTWDARALASALSQPGAFACLVAQDEDDEPLGFALLRAAIYPDGGGEAEVLTVATRPQARRRGVAVRAMQAALERARAMGVGQVFLEVAVDNTAACALYQHLGFAAVGLRKGYYARGSEENVDAAVMALSL